MHLHTIVKITAETEAEAIDNVNALLTCDGEYNIDPFDYIDDNSFVSNEVKSEQDFNKLLKQEKLNAESYLKQVKNPANANMKGFYLRMAGEALSPDRFWSTERLAYDYDFYEVFSSEDRPKEKLKVFFIETDRHF